MVSLLGDIFKNFSGDPRFMSKNDFCAYLIGYPFRYHICVNAVVVTDQVSMKGFKKVRALGLNEIVKASDFCEENKFQRAKVVCELDGAEGYVTLVGNHGKVFMEPLGTP